MLTKQARTDADLSEDQHQCLEYTADLLQELGRLTALRGLDTVAVQISDAWQLAQDVRNGEAPAQFRHAARPEPAH